MSTKIAAFRSTIPVRLRPPPGRGSGAILQRACACGNHTQRDECEACSNKQLLQRTTAHPPARDSSLGAGNYGAPSVVYDVLRAPGHPLADTTREFMEQRFGHNFSAVRVHTDSQAAESARAVHALAYTVGQHVVFGAGQYTPETPGGQQLIAHELTHTVQQRGAHSGEIVVGSDTSSAEGEARASAHAALSGEMSPVSTRANGLALQRQGDSGSLLDVPSLRLDPEIEAQIRAIEMMNRVLTPGHITSSASGTSSFSLGAAGLTLSPPGSPGLAPSTGSSPLGIPPLRLGPAPTLPPPTLTPPRTTPPWLSPSPSLTTRPLVPPGAGPSTPRQANFGDLFRALMRIPAIDSALTTLRTEAANRARSEWNSLNTGERVLVISHTTLLGAGVLAGVLGSPEGRAFTLDMIQDRDLPVPGVPGLNLRFNVTGPNQQLFLNLDLGQLIPALRR